MPIYIFCHPETGEVREIVQSIHEEHSFIDEKGIKWERIFTKPNAAIDSQSDAFDHSKNLAKIANSKGTIGDIQNFAAEQSAKREEKLGTTDPLKQKYYDSYAAERGGRRHIKERQEKLKKITKDVVIKWGNKNK